MSEERKLWRVTLRREVDVYVSAATREQAERIALDEAEDEIRYVDTEVERACPAPNVPAADRDDLVYGEPEDRTVGEVIDGVPPLSERIAAWEAEQPETLDALLAWLGRMPASGAYAMPRHLACDGGASAGDGRAMLIVEGATGPSHQGWPETIAATEAWARKTLTSRGTVSADALSAWCALPAHEDDGRTMPTDGTVLGVAIDRRIVARTAGHAARITGGPIVVETGGALDPTVWSGPGWRALIMPLREGRGPVLDVEVAS